MLSRTEDRKRVKRDSDTSMRDSKRVREKSVSTRTPDLENNFRFRRDVSDQHAYKMTGGILPRITYRPKCVSSFALEEEKLRNEKEKEKKDRADSEIIARSRTRVG